MFSYTQLQREVVLGLVRRIQVLQQGMADTTVVGTSVYARVMCAPRGVGKTTVLKQFDFNACNTGVQKVYISFVDDAKEAGTRTLDEMIHARAPCISSSSPAVVILDDFEALYSPASGAFGRNVLGSLHSLVTTRPVPGMVLVGCSNTALLPLLLYTEGLSSRGCYEHWARFQPTWAYSGIGIGLLPPQLPTDLESVRRVLSSSSSSSSSLPAQATAPDLLYHYGSVAGRVLTRHELGPLPDPELQGVWQLLRCLFARQRRLAPLSYVSVRRLFGHDTQLYVALLTQHGYVVPDTSCGPWAWLYPSSASACAGRACDEDDNV